MAAGDVVSGISSVAAAGVLLLQPGAGVEWVVHNLYYAAAVDVYFTDGTNHLKFDSDGAGARIGTVFHCTNARYLRLVNTSAGTALYGYDGIQTK